MVSRRRPGSSIRGSARARDDAALARPPPRWSSERRSRFDRGRAWGGTCVADREQNTPSGDGKNTGNSACLRIPGMSTRGRPPSWTSRSPQVERLLALVRGGNDVVTAAAAVGLPRASWYRLLRREPELQAQLEQARALGEGAVVAALFAEAQRGNWRAACEWLSLVHPERWGHPLDPRRRRGSEPQPGS
jgi:hypothetical protein